MQIESLLFNDRSSVDFQGSISGVVNIQLRFQIFYSKSLSKSSTEHTQSITHCHRSRSLLLSHYSQTSSSSMPPRLQDTLRQNSIFYCDLFPYYIYIGLYVKLVYLLAYYGLRPLFVFVLCPLARGLTYVVPYNLLVVLCCWTFGELHQFRHRRYSGLFTVQLTLCHPKLLVLCLHHEQLLLLLSPSLRDHLPHLQVLVYGFLILVLPFI